MTDTLYHEARRLIAELELVSHGATRNYESDGRGATETADPRGSTGHRPLRRDELQGHYEVDDYEPAFLPLRRRLRAATTDDELRDIIDIARRELELAKRTAAPARPEKGTIAWRRQVANDQRGATEVARLHGISRQYVYELRAKYREDHLAA